MSIFNQFPWTNFREYNLDWVIRTVKDCKDTVDAALADVSNAVAMYFADHIDTTLSVSGDAADARTVGNRLTTLQNSIPAVDSTLSISNAAADAAVVGTRVSNLQGQVTNHGTAITQNTNNIGHIYDLEISGTTVVPPAGKTFFQIIKAAYDDYTDKYPFTFRIDGVEADITDVYINGSSQKTIEGTCLEHEFKIVDDNTNVGTWTQITAEAIPTYRFTESGGSITPATADTVSSIITRYQNNEPFEVMIGDSIAFGVMVTEIALNPGEYRITGRYDLYGNFTWDTSTNIGSTGTEDRTASNVRIKGTAGAYSYGAGDFYTARSIINNLISISTPDFADLGSIIYQQSLSTDAYMLKSCKISGTTVYVTFTNDLALTLASDGTIS